MIDTFNFPRRKAIMVKIIILPLLLMISGFSTSPSESQMNATSKEMKTFRLKEILSTALAHNPLLAEGEGIIQQKEGDVLRAKAYPNPTISVQGGRGSVRDPSMGTSITERYVTLSQPLEWPGTRNAEQDAAQASTESARSGLDETKLNIMAQTKKSFFELLLLQEEVALSIQNVNTVKKLKSAVQARVKAGEAPPFEMIKVKVETLQVQKELIRTKGAVRTAQATLNSLTAGNLGENFTIQGEFQTLSDDLDIAFLSEQALSTHPAIVKAKKRVKEAQERHKRELHARIPNVTLQGSYQRDIGREAFVGGLSIPIPLWNQRQGEIAQAKGVVRQEEASFLGTRTRLQKGITQQIQNSTIAAAQIATYEDGLLQQSQEALRIAQVSFRYGEASLLDVLDAQRIMRETQLEYTRAKYDLAIALTELERVTGISQF